MPIVIECATDIKTLRLHEQFRSFSSKGSNYSRMDTYDILTTHGGVHITLQQCHYEGNKFVIALVKSSVTSKEMDIDILGLVKAQIEAELFRYEEYKIEVYKK